MRMLAVLLGLLFAGASPAQNADWVDGWFASSTSTSAHGYQSQQRGYYTLGSFQGRWRMNNDYLVSATPPRVNVGCGGVDLFGGAFSYLDPEYLVEKFERMIQAAPAFAFDLALQEFCKPCVAAMQAMENITDQLNQMQLNECRLSKGLAAVMVKPGDESVNNLMAEVGAQVSIGDSLRKNWKSFEDALKSNNQQLPDDVKPALNGCSAVFRDTFANGSVVANMATRMGLGDYADSIRGLIGDVVVTPSGNVYATRLRAPCAGNDQVDGADFIDGKFELMDDTGACSQTTGDALVQIIDERLSAIADKLRTANALDADDVRFIENSPLPVYAALRDAAIANSSDSLIAQMREPLAVAYGHKMLDDLIRSIAAMARKAKEIESDATADAASTEKCETGVVKKALMGTQELSDRAMEYRKALHQNYTKKTTEMLSQLQAGRELLELRKQTLNKQATVLKQ